MHDNRRVLGIQRDVSDFQSIYAKNSSYSAGSDISILLDEILNNDISAVFIYDDFSKLSDVDLYSISVVLKKNTSLQAITLSGVDLTDETMSLICNSLVHSNVQYLDFCNTPLDDESGSSLAALAQNNTNIRTVIVEDTLVSEEIMDEIDLACQYNETAYDAPKVVQPSGTPSSSSGAMSPNHCKTRLCVPFQFNMCPNGEHCIFSHSSVSNSSDMGNSEERDWVNLLQIGQRDAVPTGASWRAEDDNKNSGRSFTMKVKGTDGDRGSGSARRVNERYTTSFSPEGKGRKYTIKRKVEKEVRSSKKPYVATGILFGVVFGALAIFAFRKKTMR
eukprot:Tbor_TRINITY_DN2496_c0_g1::TRINITY_DN2496_c0_g1_i1::g.2592::m.2592